MPDSTSPPAETPKETAPAAPKDILDEKAYARLTKAGLKVARRRNHALNKMGTVDIVETTADSPGGKQILAVVHWVKIDQDIIAEVQPLLAAARGAIATEAKQ